MTEAIAKHLEFVQAVINRLAGNSFLLKGWSITLVSGLLGYDRPGGRRQQLSEIYRTYDYVADNGYANLAPWIEQAARQAGR